jgi:hypothetical protein
MVEKQEVHGIGPSAQKFRDSASYLQTNAKRARLEANEDLGGLGMVEAQPL